MAMLAMARPVRHAAALFVLAFCPLAQAAPQVPTEPVLRVETGAHLAQITRITADEAGRWILTASEDKTARLWDGTTGRPLAVLRPPIGEGEVGNLYAAALSPDGALAALGGNTAFEGGAHALYLFDRATARLPPKSTLSGLEAPITQLAWSRDSRTIAVGLLQQGLRVFRRDLSFLGGDPEYNEAIYGADFAPDGRLATASPDGAVRIYVVDEGGLRRVARKVLRGGRPYSVAFSPDGQRIAVGRLDAARIDILDSRTLETLRRVEVAAGGNLAKVAWSADGTTLYGGGTAVVDRRFQLYAFGDAGRAPGRPIGSFANTLTSLAAVPEGVLAASAEPSWVRLDDAHGDRFAPVAAQGGDFRDAQSSFRVADDGATVIFPMASGGKDPVRFDVRHGELTPAVRGRELNGPALPGRDHGPSDWRNSTAPRLRARPLPLRAGEMSRSVAMAPGNGFVLGSEWYLRAFDSRGKQLWQQRTPGPAWAVNVTRNGQWAVAGLGDGTVRWYRMSDGGERLALFVHADRSRWILWSPSGHYDTSIGGEALVGWHLNRAFNQAADYFPVGRFRDRLYRPEMLRKVFDDGAGRDAPAVAELLPPVLELRSDRQIATDESTVRILYVVRTPADAPVNDLKVRVNGRLERNVESRAVRDAAGEPGVQEIVVPVPPRDASVVLVAQNRNAKSEPLTVLVEHRGKAAGAPRDMYETLYMLVVGIDKYPGAELELPVKDAGDFRDQMSRAARPPDGMPRFYRRVEHRFLADEAATRDGVLQGLRWLRENVGENDVGVVFIAGHGVTQDGTYYFVPYKPAGLASGPAEWVSGDDIVATLQTLPGRTVFFLDTCYSGSLASMARPTDTINKVNDERGVIVFASSTAREQSQEDKRRWNNGAFTKAIVDGLRGGADYRREGVIYPSLLKNYVTLEVRKMTNDQQRPYANDQSIDEPLTTAVP